MDAKQEAILTAYQEICRSYHAIADFRAKLLGLLPLASGTGVFLLMGNRLELPFQVAAGLFGFVVTLGLYSYELRGIQRCHSLIAAGKQMEEDLGVRAQFASRPRPVSGFIGSTLAAQIIYPTVLAAWLFVASMPAGARVATVTSGFVFIVALVWSHSLDLDET